MKTIAYLRVSTARCEGFDVDDFVEATASSRTNAKRCWFDQLMAVLERGDRLVVSELSRLDRSLGEVVAMLGAIANPSS